VSTLLFLYSQSRISALDMQPAIPDGLIGLLFVVAFLRTRTSSVRSSGS